MKETAIATFQYLKISATKTLGKSKTWHFWKRTGKGRFFMPQKNGMA
ncbi:MULTISPECIES: hypothetical protein [Pseudoalteromonas]|nr:MULTISPECIES: hypothetical protein [Pseudoalteromonas]